MQYLPLNSNSRYWNSLTSIKITMQANEKSTLMLVNFCCNQKYIFYLLIYWIMYRYRHCDIPSIWYRNRKSDIRASQSRIAPAGKVRLSAKSKSACRTCVKWIDKMSGDDRDRDAAQWLRHTTAIVSFLMINWTRRRVCGDREDDFVRQLSSIKSSQMTLIWCMRA